MDILSESPAVWHSALLLAKILEGTSSVIMKAVLSGGVNVLILSLYASLVGAATLFAISYCIERRNRMPLNWNVVLRILFSGLCGNYAGQLLLLSGIKKTSVEFATVMTCTIPIFASVIATILRIEKVYLNRRDGQAKVLGLLSACLGAAVMTLYQGPRLLSDARSVSRDWYVGATMSIVGPICVAASVNIHTPLIRKYRAPWAVMCGVTVVAACLNGITCIAVYKTSGSEWLLPSRAAFMAIIFNGSVGIAVSLGLMAWVLSKTGLLLVCCYSSVTPISATILSLIFLGSSIYLGSILGAILVIAGLIISGWGETMSKRIDTSPLLDENMMSK